MKPYYRDLADIAPASLIGTHAASGVPAVLDFWILSDLHLGHERLEAGGPLNGVRSPNCTRLLTDRWSETVAPTDNVLVLGDVRDWLVFFTHEPLPDDDLLANCISVHGHIHHNPERTTQHINTSAEAPDYRPQRLRTVLDRRIDQLGSPPTLASSGRRPRSSTSP